MLTGIALLWIWSSHHQYTVQVGKESLLMLVVQVWVQGTAGNGGLDYYRKSSDHPRGNPRFQLKCLLLVLFFTISFFFYCTGEGVTDGGAVRGDDENVKTATFTHLLLYCLAAVKGGDKKKKKKANWWVQGRGPPEPHSPASRPW